MHHKQVYRYKKFICHRLVLVLALCSYVLGSVSENGTTHLISPHELMFYVYALISTFLACFAGLCSGLTVGYMSISKADMQLLSNSDNEQ